MRVFVRDVASNPLVQILGPLAVVGLIGVGADVGFGASLFAVAVGAAGVLWAIVQRVRSPHWRYPTERLSSDKDMAVVVSLLHEEWDAHQHTAWILRVKVKIRNRTNAVQRQDNWELRTVSARPVREVPVPGLADEIKRRQKDHPEPPIEVQPGQSVYGWLFFRFGYDPTQGVPSYDLLWNTVTGHSYGFRRTVAPPHPIEWPIPKR
jgi:hypothetical protein